MKKVFIISAMLSCFINTTSIASSIDPEIDRKTVQVILSCQTIDETVALPGNHRTPPCIPNVYFDSSTSILYFENPCYECTLELVIPGTESSVYTYIIPDGDNVVTLPEWLSGQYELHIHRGNFCFWGIIEL